MDLVAMQAFFYLCYCLLVSHAEGYFQAIGEGSSCASARLSLKLKLMLPAARYITPFAALGV